MVQRRDTGPGYRVKDVPPPTSSHLLCSPSIATAGSPLASLFPSSPITQDLAERAQQAKLVSPTLLIIEEVSASPPHFLTLCLLCSPLPLLRIWQSAHSRQSWSALRCSSSGTSWPWHPAGSSGRLRADPFCGRNRLIPRRGARRKLRGCRRPRGRQAAAATGQLRGSCRTC